jgi:hypothetical protein
MQPNVSISPNRPYDLAVEGANVNLASLRFGPGTVRGFGSTAYEAPVEKSAFAVQFYILLDVVQTLVFSSTLANMVSPQFFARSFGQRESDAHLTTSLAWMAFTQEALKDSRPMTDWERKAAADFFWSEFD